MQLKASVCSIRCLLFADVWADLLQFEPDRGDGITPSPQVLAREVPLSATHSSHRNGTLPLQEPDDGGHRVLPGKSPRTCAPGPAGDALRESGTPSAEPRHEKSPRVDAALSQTGSSAGASGRRPHGICSPARSEEHTSELQSRFD